VFESELDFHANLAAEGGILAEVGRPADPPVPEPQVEATASDDEAADATSTGRPTQDED
jgi:hypothetical protein